MEAIGGGEAKWCGRDEEEEAATVLRNGKRVLASWGSRGSV